MITINGNTVNINNNQAWMCDLPNTVKASNLKAWFKLHSLNDVTLNFQNQTGTVSTSIGSVNVTGVSTTFTSNDIGKRIRIGAEDKWISSIISNTSITVDSNFLNANSGVAYSYGYVSAIINSISSGFGDFSQTNPTAQPFIAIINGKLVVRFNQTRDTDVMSTASAFNLGAQQTYFFKVKNKKMINSSDLFNSVSPQASPRIYYQNIRQRLEVYQYATDVSNYWAAGATDVTNNNGVLCFQNKGNAWEIDNQNNKNVSSIENTGSPIVNQIINNKYSIGNYPVSQNNTYSFIGDYSEIIIYDTNLNASERDKILRYLNLTKF